jgi:hypothetical protein
VTADQIKQLAHELVERLREDIHKAANREEHIRVSARANEAHLLLEGLNQMFYGGTDDGEISEENSRN